MTATPEGSPASDGVDSSGSWEIGWSREDFERLKHEPRFHALLTIARLRNMLHFVQHLIVYVPVELSQSARNQHALNTFFLMNSLLVEAQRVVGGLGSHFRDAPHYRVISEAVNSPTFREVVDRSRPARHWSGFHFFPEGAEAVANRGYFADPPEFVPFLSAQGPLDSSVHFDLADRIPMELILGDMDRTNFEETFGKWLKDASNVTADFISNLNIFLSLNAKAFGAKRRQAPQE